MYVSMFQSYEVLAGSELVISLSFFFDAGSTYGTTAEFNVSWIAGRDKR